MTEGELKEHISAIGKYCYGVNCSDCHFTFDNGDKCLFNDVSPYLWEQKIEVMEAMK